MPLPKPTEKESEQDFVSRFMGDESMITEYPDKDQRAAVAYSLFRHRNNSLFAVRNANGWPKSFQCKFITPGLVHYEDFGNVLVRKEALDAMALSFVGKPVINVVHKEVSPEIYENAEADGIVTRVWFDPSDGWYWCEFLVWDDATQYNCRSTAYSVSCAYDVNSFKNDSGTYNNIPYDREIISGSYTHLAIVANPRYEDARIVVLNSKGGSNMKWKFWEKDKKAELHNVSDESMIEVDGKSVKVKDLVEIHNSRAAASPMTLSDDTIVEIDGKEIKVADLKNSYRASLKNADDDEEKKKKEDEERKNAEDEEKKKKEEEERKNAESEEEKKKKDEMENAKKKKGEEHFNALKKAAEMRGEPQEIKVTTMPERAVEGRKKYGTAA